MPADPTTAGGGTEGLRDGLAEWLLHRFDLRRWQADAQAAALLACGPLADFLARASVEQARVEAERDDYRQAASVEASERRRLTAERDRLLIAFHDAIRRPLGVTPDSGAEFYSYRMANEAEARRPRHGSPEERAERPETRIAAALAALDDACRMSSILLMAGEMTAQERRTARAVANGITAKVRSALKLPEAPDV